MELGMGGEVWVHARAAEQIHGELGLFQESVPKWEREIWVQTAQTGHEVILEGTYGSLRSIATMCMRWGELEADVVVVEELLEWFGTFVVKALESRPEACSTEATV